MMKQRLIIIFLLTTGMHAIQAQHVKAWKIVIGGIQVKVPDSISTSAIPGRIKQLIEHAKPNGSYLTSFVTDKFARMETGLDSLTIQKQSKARGIKPEYLKEISILDKEQGHYIKFSAGNSYKIARLKRVDRSNITTFFSGDSVTVVNEKEIEPEFTQDTAVICGFTCKKVIFHIKKLPDQEFTFWYAPQIPSFYNEDIGFAKQLPGAILAICNYSIGKRSILVAVAKTVEQVLVNGDEFSPGPEYKVQENNF